MHMDTKCSSKLIKNSERRNLISYLSENGVIFSNDDFEEIIVFHYILYSTNLLLLMKYTKGC